MVERQSVGWFFKLLWLNCIVLAVWYDVWRYNGDNNNNNNNKLNGAVTQFSSLLYSKVGIESLHARQIVLRRFVSSKCESISRQWMWIRAVRFHRWDFLVAMHCLLFLSRYSVDKIDFHLLSQHYLYFRFWNIFIYSIGSARAHESNRTTQWKFNSNIGPLAATTSGHTSHIKLKLLDWLTDFFILNHFTWYLLKVRRSTKI